jgi:integrase
MYTAAVSRHDVLKASKKTKEEFNPAAQVHLRTYFREVFKPAELVGKNEKYVSQYETAIELLLQFLRRGDRAYVNRLNEHHIEAFILWAKSKGYADITLTKYKMTLRRVLRHARPNDFLKRTGTHAREKHPHQIPIDAEGTIWRFFQRVYRAERLLGKGDRSRLDYEYTIRKLCQHVGGGVSVFDLTDELLSNWSYAMLKQDMALASIDGHLARIRALWRHARRKKLLAEDPITHRLPRLRKIPDAWSLEELAQLIEATSDRSFDCTMRNGIHLGKLLRAMILTTYDTGFRRGDILALRKVDMRADGVIVIVMQKTGEHITRAVRPETMEAIHATLPPERELLFPWVRHISNLAKTFRQLLKVAKLPGGRFCQWQKIRRTAATHLERVHPGGASALLGHKSPQMARMHYIDPRIAATQPPMPPAPPKFGVAGD